MKIVTNKFNDSFYLPIKNNSCIEDISYEVLVNDEYGLISIPNTFGPGPTNKIFISAPRVPSLRVAENCLVAKFVNGSYYLTIYPGDPRFVSYQSGKRFYIFLSNGFYSGISIDFYGYEDSTSPLFSIDKDSLSKILPAGQSLPTANSPYTFLDVFYISTEPDTSNFLNVLTSTSVKARQTASVTIKNDSSFYNYEFTVDPIDSPVTPIDQPPIGFTEKKTSQLMRSFAPVSSTITLQLDSEGHLYMDKLSSGSDLSQKSYRRRCTNLGFEKDVSSFCLDIPAQSLYSFSDEEITSSSTQFSDQYFTDINMGVSINRETPEKLRYFAPLWLKDKTPNYFLIFRKSALSKNENLLEDAGLVKVIDIHKSELGPYLEKLKGSPNFSLPPLEVSINNGYSLTWNGVSLDTGYWVNHKEFIDIDVQQGISDYEFNDIVSGGFERGSIINPQFLNIEFLFNDVSADIYNVYQYFGLYSDEIEISSFLPDIDSTQSLFKQSETRSSSNKDFNYSVINNPDGVKLAVDLNDNPDKLFNVNDPSTIQIEANSSTQSRYLVKSLDLTAGSMNFEISSDIDLSLINGLFYANSELRVETELYDFISYVIVKSISYNPETSRLKVNIQDSTELLNLQGESIWMNIFDINPGLLGKIRLDTAKQEKCRCIVISKNDTLGQSISEWLNNVVDQDQKLKDSIVIFDKSSGSYFISIAETIIEKENYFKVYVTVLESSGVINSNDQIFMHISEYDIDGAIPGPKIINSPSRKFILKTKNDSYSIKRFDFINNQNRLLGKFELDSSYFNLGQIIGSSADSSIPVRSADSAWNGVEIGFGTSLNTIFNEGDRLEINQIIGKTTKTWSIVKNSIINPEVSKIPGTVTEVNIISISSGNQYTEVEISSDYIPSQFDLFCVTGSNTSPSLILDFLRAEANDSGTYTIIFGNPNISLDYTTLQVKILESQVSYFNYSSNESIASNIAATIQQFNDCPLRAVSSNEKLILYSDDKTSQYSVRVFASPGIIKTFSFNGSYQSPISVIREDEILTANYYSYDISPIFNEKVYSMEPSFIQKIKEGTQILSKSGTPSTALKWSNGTFSVIDIKSLIENGEHRLLIKFNSENEPSLLNDRLQIFDNNRLKLSLLSFYDLVDLDLFDEIPARPVAIEEQLSQRSSTYLPNSNLFSSSLLKQKNFYLTVDIVENMFAQWKNWDPVNGSDFSFELPLTYSFSSKFTMEAQDGSGQWKNYPIQIQPATIYPSGIYAYEITDNGIILEFSKASTPADSMYILNTVVELTVSNINLLRKLQPSLALSYVGYLKSLIYFLYQNYQDTRFFSTIPQPGFIGFKINVSRTSPYLHSQGFTLNITDSEKNFRYLTSFIENSYTVKEDTVYDAFQGFGGASTINRVVNFIGSLDRSTGKFKPKVGRWKERGSTNIDGSPYLLNVDPLMPSYDLFVNVSQENPEPENFSFDWYLISGWPKSINLNDFSNNYRYLGNIIDKDLLQSLEYDYFSQYFTVGKGLEETSDGQERGRSVLWTEIYKSPDGYKTVFRGFPFIFRTDLDLTGVRFAAVLQIKEDLDSSSKINLIYNQQWKTITLLVELNVNNYTIDGSIPLTDLYTLQNNIANTDISSKLYSPAFIFSSSNLEFDIMPRIYNIKEEEITGTSSGMDAGGYQYDNYTYVINEKTLIDQSRPGDIELFGVDYVPDADYVISCDLFIGTPDKTHVNLTIPKSRIRGVFDTDLQRYRVFIDQIFDDSFFAVLSDIESGPMLISAIFSKKNTIVFNNKETQVYNATINAIGPYPIYKKYLAEISAGSILNRLYNGQFTDISISKDGYVSKSGIEFSSKAPSVFRPLTFKRGAIDSNGFVYFVSEDNTTNLFRLDGGFEPSYDKIIEYSAAEDLSLTRQSLNSFNGANTQILRINDILMWYRRVSETGVQKGFVNINDITINFPFAIGRKNASPIKNTWSDDFYLFAEDDYVDTPRNGFSSMKDLRYFLSSKAMSIPTYFRTSNFSVSNLDQSVDSSSSVQWKQLGSRLTIYADFDRIIESYLFNSGVFNYFQDISLDIQTDRTFYDITKEYIDKNLLDKYYVASIDVYSKSDQITQIVSLESDPSSLGFSKIDTINIETNRYFEFTVPVDKSQQISLAFNIKRT